MRPKEARHTGMFSKQSVSGYVLIFHRLKCNIKMSKKKKALNWLAQMAELTFSQLSRPGDRGQGAGRQGQMGSPPGSQAATFSPRCHVGERGWGDARGSLVKVLIPRVMAPLSLPRHPQTPQSLLLAPRETGFQHSTRRRYSPLWNPRAFPCWLAGHFVNF